MTENLTGEVLGIGPCCKDCGSKTYIIKRSVNETNMTLSYHLMCMKCMKKAGEGVAEITLDKLGRTHVDL
jgi:hypothetical protein